MLKKKMSVKINLIQGFVSIKGGGPLPLAAFLLLILYWVHLLLMDQLSSR